MRQLLDSEQRKRDTVSKADFGNVAPPTFMVMTLRVQYTKGSVGSVASKMQLNKLIPGGTLLPIALQQHSCRSELNLGKGTSVAHFVAKAGPESDSINNVGMNCRTGHFTTAAAANI